MAYIGKQPTIGNFQVCDAISVVNNQAAYTMQVGSVNVSPESANHMIVSLNGVIQKPTDAFTVSGSTITFASNLVTGDVINFIQILGNVLDLGVPSDNTVTTAKLSSTSVTAAKLNADIISGTTALTAEPADTDEFLVSDAGTLKRIDYSLIKGGGSLVKLAATTVSSNVANVDFTSAFTSTYSVYKIIIQGARPDTDNNAIAMRFGSGTSFDSGTNYERVVIASGLNNGNDTVDSRASTTANISFNAMSSQSSATETSTNMDLTIYNMLDSAKNTYVTVIGAYEGADDEFRTLLGSYNYNQVNARNSIRFFNTSGNNIATGTFTIYGVIT